MKVLQSGRFSRKVKKLNKGEKAALDRAVKKIINDPTLVKQRRETYWVYLFTSTSIQLIYCFWLTGTRIQKMNWSCWHMVVMRIIIVTLKNNNNARNLETPILYTLLYIYIVSYIISP